MIIEDIAISMIGVLITSILATYIYDRWIRSSKVEPAYVFNGNTTNTEEVYLLSKKEMNRRSVYKIFYILFSIYLIWASIYLPLVFKAGFMSAGIVDLTSSNLSNLLEINNASLVFNLEIVKWYCALLAILLLLPSMYIQSKVSYIFIKIKNQLYDINPNDWDKYRIYGLMIFTALILTINIYLITMLSPMYSAFIGIGAIVAIILKANEN